MLHFVYAAVLFRCQLIFLPVWVLMCVVCFVVVYCSCWSIFMLRQMGQDVSNEQRRYYIRFICTGIALLLPLLTFFVSNDSQLLHVSFIQGFETLIVKSLKIAIQVYFCYEKFYNFFFSREMRTWNLLKHIRSHRRLLYFSVALFMATSRSVTSV